MSTNKQRREAERRRLQRQLEQRRQREVARRRFTLISSIVGTLAVIVVVIVIVVAVSGGDDGKKAPAAASPKTPTTSAATTPTAAASTPPAPTTPCAAPGTAKTTSFKGVTVQYPTNLTRDSKVRSKASTDPANIECQDLVVGKGKAATTASTVSVQYSGVLYKNGTAFDSSWARGGKPASFSLAPGSVISGFSEGIGGAGKVAPMRVGGRRIIIMPSVLAYGTQGNQGVPPNAPLVFVVDLTKVSG